jgi:hypothetical protein
MKWLWSIGCDFALVNSNGHGTLHKIAQRNQGAVADWLYSAVYNTKSTIVHFGLIGPDSDGCCPSDLAGMEGHEVLARALAKHEALLSRLLYGQELLKPTWLSPSENQDGDVACLDVWEPFAGVKRINRALVDLG